MTFTRLCMSTYMKTSIIEMCPSRNHSTSSETFFATRDNNDVNLNVYYVATHPVYTCTSIRQLNSFDNTQIISLLHFNRTNNFTHDCELHDRLHRINTNLPKLVLHARATAVRNFRTDCVTYLLEFDFPR